MMDPFKIGETKKLVESRGLPLLSSCFIGTYKNKPEVENKYLMVNPSTSV